VHEYNLVGSGLKPNDVCFCDYCWKETHSMLNNRRR
jgi:hypothetical protein